MTRDDVSAFCDAHRGDDRPIVFVTSGTNWKPEALRDCVRRLLDLGIAVVSTCLLDDVTSLSRGACVPRIVDAVRASIGRKRSAEYRRSLAPLQREIRRTRAAFDFEGVLRRAVEARPH